MSVDDLEKLRSLVYDWWSDCWDEATGLDIHTHDLHQLNTNLRELLKVPGRLLAADAIALVRFYAAMKAFYEVVLRKPCKLEVVESLISNVYPLWTLELPEPGIEFGEDPE